MSDNESDTPALPPITHIKMPDMKLSSTRIRWYYALGYTPNEIKNLLGLRPQHVRNVINNPPKRMAREDLPPLEYTLHDIADDLEAMDQAAFEQEMAAARAESRQARTHKHGQN